MPNQNRRDFIKAGGAATAALLAQGALPGPARALPDCRRTPRRVAPCRPATSVGPASASASQPRRQSAIEVGGNEAVAVPIVERALDLGVNYVDTSSIYGARALE